jgi:tetratricopeptide (TPR) repeat protein
MRSRLGRIALVLCAAAPVAARAPAQVPLERALDLEQEGRLAEAAEAYRAVLALQPADVGALLGAERAYAQLGRRDSAAALARRALAVDSTSRLINVVLLRSLRALRDDSALAAAFERWTSAAPRDVAPYEEMARLLLADGRDAQARALVQRARQRLGDPRAAAAQMAEVEAREAAYGPAAEEWRSAVAREPGMLEAAVHSLRTVAPADRDLVLRTLSGGPDAVTGGAIAVDLLLAWEEPRHAWALLRGGLPESGPVRAARLRHFAEGVGRLDGVEARRMAAEALELSAQSQTGPDAARTRIESARAFAAAGDVAAARRLLRAMAEAPGTPSGVASAARATLVELAAAEGAPGEAARLLEQERASLSVGEFQHLARRVAFAWVRSGAVDRAEAAVAGDSSLAGDEVRGWVALFRGDLDRAAATLRAVGADAGDPDRAPERAAAVALASAVGRDPLPALGAALLMAAEGDTLGSSRALAGVARALDGDAQAEVRLWAARFAAAAHDTAAAVATWEEVAARPGASTAGAAALLSLARVAATRGRFAEAADRLEELILRDPESALVPEARRELDRVRGLVPRS